MEYILQSLYYYLLNTVNITFLSIYISSPKLNSVIRTLPKNKRLYWRKDGHLGMTGPVRLGLRQLFEFSQQDSNALFHIDGTK